MDAEKLLLELVEAETEDQVEDILNAVPLCSDPANWLAYGNKENNVGTVQNQSAEAIPALVEKIINSIEAVLMLKCREAGLDPESKSAPDSIQDATAKYFGVREGLLVNASKSERGMLAEFVQVVASGKKTSPCISIIDQGEGQAPHRFCATFLSLHENNKNRIRFVQGKFNMGGTGALPFCGKKHFQLLVSRRAPALARMEKDRLWGFTLVRKFPPMDGSRTSSYKYLAPGGQMLTIQKDRAVHDWVYPRAFVARASCPCPRPGRPCHKATAIRELL